MCIECPVADDFEGILCALETEYSSTFAEDEGTVSYTCGDEGN